MAHPAIPRFWIVRHTETAMEKGRLEAFTDGVIAIIITIMVLEMKVPQGATLAAMAAGFPVFLAYALSYTNVGVFWNNHHHMLQATERVDGRVLWVNLLLLFWISLIPFAIRWMDETHFASLPTAIYGVVLVLSAISYLLLERAIVACNGPDSKLAKAIGGDLKTKLSLSGYAVAIAVAFYRSWMAIALYILIAMVWFVPDKRIEKIL
jgi:uncharacterized membrane protein